MNLSLPSKVGSFITVESLAKQGGPSLKSSSAPSYICLSIASVILSKLSFPTKLASATSINCSKVKGVPSTFNALRSVFYNKVN